jgi:hypothetical protein
MIPARYFKENFILVRNIIVEDRRFNANVLSANYNALQVQPGSDGFGLFLLDYRLMILTGRWAAAEL